MLCLVVDCVTRFSRVTHWNVGRYNICPTFPAHAFMSKTEALLTLSDCESDPSQTIKFSLFLRNCSHLMMQGKVRFCNRSVWMNPNWYKSNVDYSLDLPVLNDWQTCSCEHVSSYCLLGQHFIIYLSWFSSPLFIVRFITLKIIW